MKSSKIREISQKIADLTFAGEHSEARSLYAQFKNELNGNELFRIKFHLGLSYTRTSEYNLAKKIFVENYRDWLQERPLGEEGFYVFQGLSFYRFFFSRHKSSLAFAKKALSSLQASKKKSYLPYALVYDLLAHNYFQLGVAAKGDESLKKAIEKAKEGKLEGLVKEFQASIIIYQSDYSTDVEKSLRKLKKLLKETPETNDYTLSEVVLQISKLLFLKGEYDKSNDFLISNFKVIYKNENKRKVAKLNNLLAMLMKEKKQFIEALSLLKVAKRNLNQNVDMNLLIPCLGLETSILEELKQDSSEEKKSLEKALEATDKSIPHRIGRRLSSGELEPQAEDQLGELIDKIFRKDIEGLNQAIEKNLLHLAKSFFPKSKTSKCLFIHPQNKGILIASEGKVHYAESKISKIQLSLISELSGGSKTKEELIQKVWGYEYDPIRHDHLVYSGIRRLRSLLGKYSSWIISDENNYRWGGDVSLVLSSKKSSSKTKTNVNLEDETFSDFNFRQIQVLEGAFEKPFSAGDHSEYFSINRMTSFRDLKELVEAGLLIKRGKGKGTKYCLH